jgi:hypothetical protein
MSDRTKQFSVAGVVLALCAGMLVASTWPFDFRVRPLPDRPSLAQFVLSDRLTVGFVRLALVLVALFVVVSIPALIVAGRWIKGFGRDGFSVDEAAKRDLASADQHLARLSRERDWYKTWAELQKRIADDALQRLPQVSKTGKPHS